MPDSIAEKLESLEGEKKTEPTTEERIKLLEAERDKFKGEFDKVREQRDTLKKKIRETIQPQDGGKDFLTLEAEKKSLEERLKSLEERDLKRKESLDLKWSSKIEALPEDKRGVFGPILEQLKVMEPEARLEWWDKNGTLITGTGSEKGHAQTSQPSFNPPKDTGMTLTADDQIIARKYGWSTERAIEIKTESPSTWKKAVENLKR